MDILKKGDVLRKILAVSGGIDSMVLMYIFRNDPSVVVAHFNHGTRESCRDDEEFVCAKAKEYGLEYVVGHGELGENVSEEQARYSRYEFFSKVAEKYDGEMFVAHHGNDLIESMAINLARGTGWRGLAPFGNKEIWRPFIEPGLLPSAVLGELFEYSTPVLREPDYFVVFKDAIYRYAYVHDISFRQDPTNSDDKYLRNRIRSEVSNLLPGTILGLLKIYHRTNILKGHIDTLVEELLPGDVLPGGREYRREWFYDMPGDVAVEVLRGGLIRAGISATRPQIRDFLSAIKNYAPGKKFNLPGDKLVEIKRDTFWL